MEHIALGNIDIELTKKNIKNVHLSVHPPNGRVTISAPKRMDLETIRVYASSKLNWIKKQQKKIASQNREPIREYVNRESHYYQGKRYLLKINEKQSPPNVKLTFDKIVLSVRPHSTKKKRMSVLDEWYRKKLKEKIPNMIRTWEKEIPAKVSEFGIKKMKTRWGSCNINKKRIWLNLELAKKPIECLEYVLVHEMVHLLEKNHNEKFYSYMNRYYPNWKHSKDLLDKLPVSHNNWNY